MSDNKPKIPDMPDFLKKEEDKVPPPKVTPPPPPITPNNPGVISPAAEVEKVAEIKAEAKAETPQKKRRFLFGKRKGKIPLIEFRNDQGEMVPSAPPERPEPEATLNDYFPPWVGQLLGVLLLAAVGTGLFYYYQSEAYKEKYQAMDSRVLSFTKEIASLNQENNTLSGKIVNYQKELDGSKGNKVEELEKQVIDLQNQIAAYQAAPATTVAPGPAVGGTTTVAKPTEAADPVPTAARPAVPTSPPPVVANTPAAQGRRPVPKATDPSVNYESRLKTKGELSCLQYYKTENLKKCQSRDAKYTAVMIGSKTTPTGTKLTYQCQGQGAKPLNFKYGPMEIFNNCSGR